MPNYCENRLGVVGPYEEVQAFIKNARGTPPLAADAKPQPLCFQTLFPAETSSERVSDPSWPGLMIERWFTDRVEKWGTKWDADCWGKEPAWKILTHFEHEWDDREREPTDECCAIIRFGTAWGPPLKLFDKVAQDYPNLAFRLGYKEHNERFKGVAEWRAGTRTKDERWEWETLDATDWH